MKSIALIVGLLIAASSMGVTTSNGLTLTNFPTISNSYSKSTNNPSEVGVIEDAMKKECLKDKASAEALATKSSSTILASKGCTVVVENQFNEMSWGGIQIKTQFEVVIK